MKIYLIDGSKFISTYSILDETKTRTLKELYNLLLGFILSEDSRMDNCNLYNAIISLKSINYELITNEEFELLRKDLLNGVLSNYNEVNWINGKSSNNKFKDLMEKIQFIQNIINKD
jgi:hypothetical protein